MRLAIIGGGGFRVPLVYRALAQDTSGGRVTEVVLHDTDPDRVQAIDAVLAQQGSRYADSPAVRVAACVDEAVAGADFVFSAMRIGGLAGRVADERVAIAHGLLGQETVGAGGLAYGLRTIPAALELAGAVQRESNAAWLINFTNPAGLVTEAMAGILGDRVVGICDSPLALARRGARALGRPLDELEIDYAGLNHLGWLQGLRDGETDLLPELLADDAALAPLEETQIFGADWLRTLRAIPNEYLHYYYSAREAVAEQAAPGYATRGEYLAGQQGSCFHELLARPDDALQTWEGALAQRNSSYMASARGEGNERHEEDLVSGGYEGVALALMAALARDEPARLILNVRAGDRLGLPADAVVELPCAVDGSGIAPLPTSPLPLAAGGLVHQVKGVERDLLAAALTGDPQLAVRAFATHPLIDSVAIARGVLTAYRAAIPEVDAVFAGR